MQLSNGFNIEHIREAMVIRFDCPEIRNPLSVMVLDGLIELIANLHDHVRVLVFTGCDDVFASGADLREIAKVDGSNAPEFAERGQRLMNMIAELDVKTIAAVNGYCY